MKTTLPFGLPYQKLATIFLTSLLFSLSAISQDAKGKDGAASYFLPGSYIPNRYSSLASTVTAGALSVTVTNIAELSGSYSFLGSTNPYATNALSKGDLIMIIQVQGADITTTDDASYGAITNFRNTGEYELKTVFNVSGNTISLCENVSRTYVQGARSRAQVVRIPRLTSLSVSSGATVSGMAWNGSSGGIVVLETTLDMTINGAISGNSIGFRGGVDDKANSITSGSSAVTLYRTTVLTTTAGKGESIAGNTADYNTYLNGSNGRGAPANGGGGGNGHNSGGGGGSNAGNNGALSPWNGTGLKNNSTAAWTAAWNLESAGFASNISVGAGRGGYSYSNSNQDALILAPGNATWGGDKRNIVGGLGGRPLDYSNNTPPSWAAEAEQAMAITVPPVMEATVAESSISSRVEISVDQEASLLMVRMGTIPSSRISTLQVALVEAVPFLQWQKVPSPALPSQQMEATVATSYSCSMKRKAQVAAAAAVISAPHLPA